MNTAGETIERAIVFEGAYGYRRLSAQRCLTEWRSQFAGALLQVDLALGEPGPVLFVILRFREDRFDDALHARIVETGEHAGGRVLPLSELEYRERGHFLTRLNECADQRLGLEPDKVLSGLLALFKGIKERRKAVRHPVEAAAVMKVGGEAVQASVEDLSAGGALLRTSQPPAPKAKVELEVTLPSGPVSALATVVNVSERGVSLQFAAEAAHGLEEKLEALPQAKLDTQLTVASLTTAPSEPKPAALERVGNYELLSVLGVGGTAEVHFARVLAGPKQGQHVALKRLHQRRTQDAEAVKYFEKEATTLALLKHANIVRTLDAGVFDGHQCLVMELIDGHDLGQILRKARAKKKPLPVDVACYAAKVLLDALGAVHAAKDAKGAPLELVHGDVSPHNLFVSKTGIIKLGDFGLTRRASLEVAGTIEQGRPTYLSPEVLDGEVSQAADLWAAAVTLYELLTLEQPFGGNTLDELTEAIRHEREAPLRDRRDDVSGPLEAVLKGALEKDRTLRFQTAKDFADAVSPHFHPVRAPKRLADVVKELFSSNPPPAAQR
ncbi:MAG: protein kinase [Archangium sp.]|nr:protein kinase [Archangium sp.]